MKIVDILKDSAMMLGLTQEVEILDTVTEENETQILEENVNVASLFNLVKYSIREFCTNYMPINCRQKINTTNKQYPIGIFENFIRINNITRNDQFVRFKIVNRNITLEEDGEYMVSYATYPIITTMFVDVDFLENYNPDVLVFGLCAYFALAHGMFEEFEEFHDRYITRAESLKNLRLFDLPCRRWE